jgi:glutathione S-transferase
MPYYTAIVTLLAGAFYFSLATRVSVAHSRFNVSPPATTGNPDFERIFRAHMNTLEWMPTFGAAVALCNLLERRRRYSAGVVWIAGLLFIGAATGVVMHLSGC